MVPRIVVGQNEFTGHLSFIMVIIIAVILQVLKTGVDWLFSRWIMNELMSEWMNSNFNIPQLRDIQSSEVNST